MAAKSRISSTESESESSGTSTATMGSGGGAAATAAATHILIGGRYVTQVLFPYSGGEPGAATAEISLAHMDEFIALLDNRLFTITAMAIAAQNLELETKVAPLLTSLSAGNPIQGVRVVRSRVTGDPTVWASDSLMWVYPTTTLTGATPRTFAVGTIQNSGGAVVGYAHASIAAVLL